MVSVQSNKLSLPDILCSFQPKTRTRKTALHFCMKADECSHNTLILLLFFLFSYLVDCMNMFQSFRSSFLVPKVKTKRIELAEDLKIRVANEKKNTVVISVEKIGISNKKKRRRRIDRKKFICFEMRHKEKPIPVYSIHKYKLTQINKYTHMN